MSENPVKQDARARGSDGKFLPSVSGNPKGRPPRAHCLSDAIYELLSNNPEEVIAKWKKGKMTGARYAAVAWYKKVHAGDLTALNIGLERTEGKVTQPISGDLGIYRSAKEMSDDELSDIIASGGSGRASSASSG